MSDIAEPGGGRSPRRTIVIVLAVLALSWFAFPAAVASWLYDSCGEAAYCPPLQTVADGVDSASRALGVAGTFEGARDSLRAFLAIDYY